MSRYINTLETDTDVGFSAQVKNLYQDTIDR